MKPKITSPTVELPPEQVRGGFFDAAANYWITCIHTELEGNKKAVPAWNLSSGGAGVALDQCLRLMGFTRGIQSLDQEAAFELGLSLAKSIDDKSAGVDSFKAAIRRAIDDSTFE